MVDPNRFAWHVDALNDCFNEHDAVHEDGSPKRATAYEHARDDLAAWVRSLASAEVAESLENLHALRREIESFYEATTAYWTLLTIIQVVEEAFSERVRSTSAHGLVELELVKLIRIDADVFSAIQLSDAKKMKDAAKKAIRHCRHACGLASRVSDDWQRSLLAVEIDLQVEFYNAFVLAGCFCERYLAVASEAYESGEALNVDADQCMVWGARIREQLAMIEEIARALPSRENQADEIRLFATNMTSELRPWIDMFEAMARVCRERRTEIRLDFAEFTYCYPFACVTGLQEGLFEDALKEVFARAGTRGRKDHKNKESPSNVLGRLHGDLVRAHLANDREDALVRLSDNALWDGTDDVVYDGAKIKLDLSTFERAPNWSIGRGRYEASVKLSVLGNHLLTVSQRLDRPLPIDLYRAFRAGNELLCVPRDITDRGPRHIHDFARFAIAAVVQSLTKPLTDTCRRRGRRAKRSGAANSESARSYRIECHIVAIINSPRRYEDEAQVRSAIAESTVGRVLLGHTNRVASTPLEWMQVPTPINQTLGPVNSALRGDWLLTSVDTTVFLVSGVPSWSAEALSEAAQFAASCSARLLLWDSQLFRLISDIADVRNRKRVEDLKSLQRAQLEAERFIASITSPSLCWKRAHRALLDQLIEATGAIHLANDVRRRLATVELILNEQVSDEQRRFDLNRNRLLTALAVFSVLNVSTFFELYQGRHTTLEIGFQIILLCPLIAYAAYSYFDEQRHR